MASFYVREGDYLVSSGHCPDGQEDLHAAPGQCVMLGDVPGFTGAMPPFNGARWSLSKAAWVDMRPAQQKADDDAQALLAARRLAYPPLADLADALYWQSEGDNSKMDAYNAAVAAVKARFPKASAA